MADYKTSLRPWSANQCFSEGDRCEFDGPNSFVLAAHPDLLQRGDQQLVHSQERSGSRRDDGTEVAAGSVFSVGEIAAYLGCELPPQGNETILIRDIARLDAQDASGCMSFCNLRGLEARAAISGSTASLICVARDLDQDAVPRNRDAILLRVDDPRLAFIRAANHFFPEPRSHPPGIASSAIVHASAVLGADVCVGEGAIVEADCRIGTGCTIGPQVVLHRGTSLGCNVVIQAGAVLGTDGYGFERDAQGHLHRFPHRGSVRLGDNVEIGARVCIDRGGLGDTVIGAGCKIDDGAYIAHNVTIGCHCLIMAHTVVCGSSRIGSGAEVSPGAVIRDKVSIGDGARIGLGAVVVADVAVGECVAGVPARAFVSGGPDGKIHKARDIQATGEKA